MPYDVLLDFWLLVNFRSEHKLSKWTFPDSLISSLHLWDCFSNQLKFYSASVRLCLKRHCWSSTHSSAGWVLKLYSGGSHSHVEINCSFISSEEAIWFFWQGKKKTNIWSNTNNYRYAAACCVNKCSRSIRPKTSTVLDSISFDCLCLTKNLPFPHACFRVKAVAVCVLGERISLSHVRVSEWRL